MRRRRHLPRTARPPHATRTTRPARVAPAADPRRRGGEDGFALLAAIVILMAISGLVAGFALAARARLDAAADRIALDRLDLLAEGLVTVAAHGLATAAAAAARPPFAPDGTLLGCAAGGLAIRVRVQDQRGLVDLNAAEAALLGPALRSLGLSAAAAGTTARAILAYRDPDPDAEAAALALPVRGGAKGAPFAAVEELHAFAALAPVPAARLAATFTTVSGQAQVAGPRLPAGLAAVLPRVPTPTAPFVSAEAAGPGRYTVEIFVRAADGSLGQAGRLFEVEAGTATPGPRLRRAEDLPGAAATVSCAALFGAAAAHLETPP